MCSAEQTKGRDRGLVATRPRQLREGLDCSQDAVATDLGISQSTLSAYEIGTRAISIDRLAAYYGVSLPELLTPCPSRVSPSSAPRGNTGGNPSEQTDFGEIAVGASAARDFVIENSGTGMLFLGDSPPAQLSGTDSSDFEIMSQPNTTVPPGENITFTVRFTPSATGTRNATVTVRNNDTDEDSFQFSIVGAATAPQRH